MDEITSLDEVYGIYRIQVETIRSKMEPDDRMQ